MKKVLSLLLVVVMMLGFIPYSSICSDAATTSVNVWPGQPMEIYDNINNVYYFDIPLEYNCFIFSDGNYYYGYDNGIAWQTEDLSYVGNNRLYVPNLNDTSYVNGATICSASSSTYNYSGSERRVFFKAPDNWETPSCYCWASSDYLPPVEDRVPNISSDIKIGDCITLGTYLGEPIVWRCVAIDDNGPLMLSEDVLCFKEYDAPGESELYHSDGWGYIRKSYGSSCWQDSNIRQWLNSDEDSVSWTHCLPSYAEEAGFLSNFTASERDVIKTVNRLINVNIWETTRSGYCDGGNTDSIGTALLSDEFDPTYYYHKYIEDTFFLLSAIQYNTIYRTNKDYLKASSPYSTSIINGNNYACYELISTIDVDGTVISSTGVELVKGIRPAFYLDTDKYTLTDETNNSEKENEYINQHVDFVNSNKYWYLTNYCDISDIVLSDYASYNDDLFYWRLLRGNLFNNPYEIILADLILSENSANAQKEAYSLNLYSSQRSIINSVTALIEGKVDLSVDKKNRLQKLFETKDFSDTETYKLCKEILPELIDDNTLNELFQVYDTSNKFLSLIGDGQDVVNAVINVINYCSVLDAYINTSEEFKQVLAIMASDQYEPYDGISLTINKYLAIDDESEVRDEILKKVASEGIDVGVRVFGESIEKHVTSYLLANMDLSKISKTVASKVVSFVEGLKIGYDVGVGINNILFNTDKTSDAFIEAYAAAKFTDDFGEALELIGNNLSENPTMDSANMFCQAFGMYKNSQIIVVDDVIGWFATQQQAWINRLTGEDLTFEVGIYNWHIYKLNWTNVNCHDESLEINGYKSATVACPTDVTLYDVSGNVVLEIKNNEIIYSENNIVATVRNNIKYITFFSNEDYKVRVDATAAGTMSYAISNYDEQMQKQAEILFRDISIGKGEVLTGSINSTDEFTIKNNILESDTGEFKGDGQKVEADEWISVDDLCVNKDYLELKVGESSQITYEVYPINASNKMITWYSSDPRIVSVDEYGNVSALSYGNATITAMMVSGDLSREVSVVVDCLFNLGDVNLDGSINILDATQIQRHLAQIIHLDDIAMTVADANSDGQISIIDATHIQRFIAQLIPSL